MDELYSEFEEPTTSVKQEWKEKDADFDRIIKQFDSIDSDDRRWAIYDLEEYDPELTVDLMIRGIQDEHRAVREAAAEILKTFPAEVCATHLVPLLGSVRIEVRNITASVLIALGDGAVEDLNAALFHENEDVRKFGADILGLNGSISAVPNLCKAIYDQVDNVVVAAIEALGKIGSNEALDTLYAAYTVHLSLHDEIIEAIGLIGDASSLEFLESHLDTDNPLELFSILDALGNIGQKSVVEKLVKLLDKNVGPLQEQVFWTILKIGRINKINVLNKINFTPTMFKNGFGLDNELLGYLDYQFSQEPNQQVLETFYNRKSQIPVGLLVTLVKSTPPQAHFEKEVLNLTEHADDWLAHTATDSLSHFDSPSVRLTILKKLNEGRRLVVMAAIKVAIKLDISEAREIIAKLSESDDEDIRTTAQQALGA